MRLFTKVVLQNTPELVEKAVHRMLLLNLSVKSDGYFSDQNEISTAELGKVDAGGGGTWPSILARGMEVIDAGPALLSMHVLRDLRKRRPMKPTGLIQPFVHYR